MKDKKFKTGDRVTPICSFDGPRTEVELSPGWFMPAREMDKIGKPATIVVVNWHDSTDEYMIQFDGEDGPCGWWNAEYLEKID